MKNLHSLKSPKRGRNQWPRLLVLLLLALLLGASLLGPINAAPTTSYDSLRLLTEALYEISQKYVWPKSEEEIIYGALRGMMNSLDPDSSFLTAKEYQQLLQGKKGQEAEAGMELIVKDHLLTVAAVIDGGAASRAGLKPGDHILKIDGQMVRNLTTQEAARRFKGAAGTSIKLQVLRNGEVKPLDLTVILEPVGATTVTSRLIDDYAYLRVSYFNDATPGELADALKALKRQQPPRGIILDLRSNARGTIEQAVRTASVLLGGKEVVTTRGRTDNSQETYSGKDRDLALKPPVPMVVLVDQGTARAAEIVAGALRDQSQATLLGAKTLGLCGLTKVFPLQDGSAVVMTVAQCYTPSGQKIQGKGLEPEVAGKTPPPAKGPAKAPPKQVTPEQDPWVQQAVEILKTGKPRQVAQKEESR